MKTIKVQAEEFLQQSKGVKKSYLRIFMIFLISIIGFSIFLTLTCLYGPFVNSEEVVGVNLSKNFFLNYSLTYAVSIISIVAFGLMIFPFICLFSLWIIGVNQVSKSPIFHFFLWMICAILLTLLLIALILFVRASIYSYL